MAAPSASCASSSRFSLLPLGDSITDGGSKPRSYRYHLHRLLSESGYEVDWLGSMVGVHDRLTGANATAGRPLLDEADWPLAKQRHEGHWGWTSHQVLHGHTRQPQRGQLSKWLHPGKGRALEPQVVTLLLGTNDLTKHVIKEGGPILAVVRNIRGIVRRVCRANPQVLLLLASLTPYCRHAAADSAGRARRRAVERGFNARLHALCTRKPPGCAHARLACVNLTAAVSCGQLIDGVHPSPAGARAMARTWHRALVPLLRDQGGSACGVHPRPSRLTPAHS
jgi:lysophospholipase L1-like esterase